MGNLRLRLNNQSKWDWSETRKAKADCHHRITGKKISKTVNTEPSRRQRKPKRKEKSRNGAKQHPRVTTNAVEPRPEEEQGGILYIEAEVETDAKQNVVAHP